MAAVRVWVHDLEAARRFYGEQLGMAATGESPGHVVYEPGGAPVIVEALAADDPEAGRLVGRVLGVSLEVADATAAAAELSAAGVRVVGEPERQPWGGVLAFVEDPSGNVVTLAELSDPA